MNKIEYKFLVSPDIERWLEKQEYRTEKIEQFYVDSDIKATTYYQRVAPSTYQRVTVGEHENEVIQSVTAKEYTKEKENHIGKIVVQKNYDITKGNEGFLVQKYVKKLRGIYILVASFENERNMRESETLQMLEPFVLKQIDRDTKYTPKSLALSIKPMEYNLQKMYDKIDEFEAANLFFWQVPSRVYVRDGVTLVLYRNLRLLHHYKMNFQKKHMSATLHRLRVLMRRTATMLDAFPELFTPNVKRFSVNLLRRYHEETKLLRYLYFLEELCSTKENAKMTLYSELKSLTSQEETEVTQMFLSQPFGQLIQILTRELYEQELQQFKPLKKSVKKVVKKRLKTLESLIAQTIDGYDEALLEKLYDSMDELQTLIEDFFHIIGEKETHYLVEELNILLKPLREYRNCNERESMLLNMQAQSDIKTLDISPLLCEHKEELDEKITNALRLLRSSKFRI